MSHQTRQPDRFQRGPEFLVLSKNHEKSLQRQNRPFQLPNAKMYLSERHFSGKTRSQLLRPFLTIIKACFTILHPFTQNRTLWGYKTKFRPFQIVSVSSFFIQIFWFFRVFWCLIWSTLSSFPRLSSKHPQKQRFHHFKPIFGPELVNFCRSCQSAAKFHLELQNLILPFFIILTFWWPFSAAGELSEVFILNLIVYRPSESNQNHIRNRYHNSTNLNDDSNFELCSRSRFQNRKKIRKLKKVKTIQIFIKSWFFSFKLHLAKHVNFQAKLAPKGVVKGQKLMQEHFFTRRYPFFCQNRKMEVDLWTKTKVFL